MVPQISRFIHLLIFNSIFMYFHHIWQWLDLICIFPICPYMPIYHLLFLCPSSFQSCSHVEVSKIRNVLAFPLCFGSPSEDARRGFFSVVKTAGRHGGKIGSFKWGIHGEFMGNSWGIHGEFMGFQLVGGFEHFLFSHILGIIIPID